MWLMNVEPLIGNFDPWAVCFAYGAFRPEHSLCLVELRTRRPSCHARLALVRCFNWPQCYLDVTRLCGISVSVVIAFNAGSHVRQMWSLLLVPLMRADALVMQRSQRLWRRLPSTGNRGIVEKSQLFALINHHSSYLGRREYSFLVLYEYGCPLRGPDKEPSFPISRGA